jgi:drug/metabolite transporter (DMT)-like permease
VISRRHPPGSRPPPRDSGVAAIIAMLASPDRHPLLSLPLEGVLAALFLAYFCTFLAFWFWQEGVARIGASRSGFFLYLMPLATMLLAVPYLKEPFGWVPAAGGLLVLLGVAMTERRKRSRE